MTISLHLHDVKVHDRIRARLAAEAERLNAIISRLSAEGQDAHEM